MQTKLIRLTLALFISTVLPAFCATRTWDGSGANNFWTNSSNWSLNLAPVNGDAIVFPGGVPRIVNTNTAGGPTNLLFLQLTGSNYVIFGPSLTLTNGLTNSPPVTESNRLNCAVSLGAHQTWLGASKTILAFGSNVTLSAFDLTLDLDGVLEVFGNLTGSAGSQLLKNGEGDLKLLGSANSHPDLRVLNGTLVIDGTLAGSLSISNGASLSGNGTVPPFTSRGIVTPGFSEDGILTVSSGAASFLSGSMFRIELHGSGTPGSDYDQLKVSSPPSLSGASLGVIPHYFPVVGEVFVIITNTGASAFATTFAGRPEGSTHIVNNIRFTVSYVGGDGNDVTLTVSGYNASGLTRTWSGAGTNNLWMNRSNWTGNIAPIQGDNLIFPAGASRASNSNNFPAGTTFNAITINSNSYTLGGSAVRINNGLHGGLASSTAIINIPLILAQPQTFTNSGGGTLHFRSLVDNAGYDLTLRVDAGTNWFELNSVIAGAGGLVKNGAGVVRFTGSVANTYTGPTTVNEGRIELSKTSSIVSIPGDLVIGDGIGGPGADVVRMTQQGQIADNAVLTVNSSGLFDHATVTETLGGVHGTGQIMIAGTLNCTATNGTTVFSGTISGNGGFTKTGAGTQVLAGTNTYTGTTRVQSTGRLQIDGFQPANHVFIGGGGRLQGSGTVGEIEINGNSGVLAPGSSPGLLTSSNYHIGIGSAFLEIELNGTVPGTGYDQLKVRGTVNLASVTLNVFLNFASALSNQFLIINNDGADPVVSTFSGKVEGSTVAAGGEQFRITYVGGDGNDVVLTQLTGTVAEPPTLQIELVSADAVRLLWPTNPPGFNLESNTNLATTNWLAAPPLPTVAGTNNVVTNATSESQNFYRLKK